MTDAIQLDGMVVIITGGAGDIGAATARLMSARGARIAIADIAFDTAEALAAELPESLAVKLDLEHQSSIKAMVAEVAAHFGRIDVLHNNTAPLAPEIAQADHDIEHMDTDLWDRTYRINVRGTMIACREVLPHLRATRGNIVNTVSNLALQGNVIQAAYSSSKAAIIQMTRSIATSHGKLGIRCNAVGQGITMAPALNEAFPSPLRERVGSETTHEQLGTAEDIAQAVAFLASPAARNITGQVLLSDADGVAQQLAR